MLEVFCRQKRPIGRIFCSRAVFVTELGIIVVLHPLINTLVEVFIIALQDSLESYT